VKLSITLKEERRQRVFENRVLSRMSGAYSSMGVRRGVYRVIVWKPEGKRPLGR